MASYMHMYVYMYVHSLVYRHTYVHTYVRMYVCTYHIRWKFGVEFILVVWWITKSTKLNTAKFSFLLSNACKIQ